MIGSFLAFFDSNAVRAMMLLSALGSAGLPPADARRFPCPTSGFANPRTVAA